MTNESIRTDTDLIICWLACTSRICTQPCPHNLVLCLLLIRPHALLYSTIYYFRSTQYANLNYSHDPTFFNLIVWDWRQDCNEHDLCNPGDAWFPIHVTHTFFSSYEKCVRVYVCVMLKLKSSVIDDSDKLNWTFQAKQTNMACLKLLLSRKL